MGYHTDLASLGSRLDADQMLVDERLDALEDAVSATPLAARITDLEARVAALEAAQPHPAPQPEPTSEPEPEPGISGVLRLTATFASIAIELPSPDVGAASVQYRAAGEAWRDALPLWFVVGEDAYTGSILRCLAGTAYDVRVTCGGTVYQDSITTRSEDIPDATTLVPTHTVGIDYPTLIDAFADAPAGAIVALPDGPHDAPVAARDLPITLVGSGGAVIQPPGTITSWRTVTLVGPVSGQPFTVWHGVSPIADPNQIHLEGGDGLPEIVGCWNREPKVALTGHTMATPEGWAEVLYVNDLYRYGFATFGTDVYLRLPGDRDPNQYTARVHRQAGYDKGRVILNGPDSRVTGVTFNLIDLGVGAAADRLVVEGNRFVNADIYTIADPNAIPNDYPEDVVIEHNDMRHTSLYDPNLNHDAIAWKWVKGPMYIGGVKTGWSRVGDQHEVTAIGGRGGFRRVTIRRNHLEGYFNAVGAQDAGFDRFTKSEYDVYENTIRWMADDVFEPDGGGMNWRVWDNDVAQSSVLVSLGPARRGPLYFWNNQALGMSNAGVGLDTTGDSTVKVVGFKYSGNSIPPLLAYVVGNTFQSDDPDAIGGSASAGGSGSPEHFYLRNNLFSVHRYVFSAKAGRWDEDYNAWTTTDPTRGLEVSGKNYNLIADYRAATGQGAHSNPHGDFHDPILLNADGTLPEDSPLREAGCRVVNIAEPPDGRVPDIGAHGSD